MRPPRAAHRPVVFIVVVIEHLRMRRPDTVSIAASARSFFRPARPRSQILLNPHSTSSRLLTLPLSEVVILAHVGHCHRIGTVVPPRTSSVGYHLVRFGLVLTIARPRPLLLQQVACHFGFSANFQWVRGIGGESSHSVLVAPPENCKEPRQMRDEAAPTTAYLPSKKIFAISPLNHSRVLRAGVKNPDMAPPVSPVAEPAGMVVPFRASKTRANAEELTGWHRHCAGRSARL